jgi:hypothetical protein
MKARLILTGDVAWFVHGAAVQRLERYMLGAGPGGAGETEEGSSTVPPPEATRASGSDRLLFTPRTNEQLTRRESICIAVAVGIVFGGIAALCVGALAWAVTRMAT